MEPGVNRDQFWCLVNQASHPVLSRKGSPWGGEGHRAVWQPARKQWNCEAASWARRRCLSRRCMHTGEACRELAIHGRADLTNKPRCMMSSRRSICRRGDKTRLWPDIRPRRRAAPPMPSRLGKMSSNGNGRSSSGKSWSDGAVAAHSKAGKRREFRAGHVESDVPGDPTTWREAFLKEREPRTPGGWVTVLAPPGCG